MTLLIDLKAQKIFSKEEIMPIHNGNLKTFVWLSMN